MNTVSPSPPSGWANTLLRRRNVEDEKSPLLVDRHSSSEVDIELGRRNAICDDTAIDCFPTNFGDADLISERLCGQSCCQDTSSIRQSFFKVESMSVEATAGCYVSLAPKKEPFIPQSYNYQDFENNQTKALKEKSPRIAADLIKDVLKYSFEQESAGDDNQVSNGSTLVNSRFLPTAQTLTKDEEREAAEHHSFCEHRIHSSLTGYYVSKARTIGGKELLLIRAACPTNNVNCILRRRSLVEIFASDDILFENVEEILSVYERYEVDFCSRLYSKAAKLPGRIEAYLKFSLIDIPESLGRTLNEWIRQNTFAVTMNNCVKTCQDAINTFLYPLIAVVLMAFGFSQVFSSFLSLSARSSLDSLTSRYIGQTGLFFSMVQSLDFKAAKIIASFLGAISILGKWVDAKGYFYAEQQVKRVVEGQMEKVSKCLLSMKKLYELISAMGEVANNFEHFNTLRCLFESKDIKVQRMFRAVVLLNTCPSYLRFGPSLVIWTCLLDKDVRDRVIGAITAIGEIDANMALSRCIRNSCAKCPFSFPDLVEGKSAIFSVKEGHFPPLSQSPCNIGSMSIDLDTITIITGENGTGKSTFAITWLNILLSTLSFGIAPCANGSKISMFDRIVTLTGVGENNEESSQQAHERFTRELMLMLQNHPHEKCFVLLDELYKTTNSEKASLLLQSLAENLGAYSDRVRIVFISHSKEFANDHRVEASRYTTFRRSDGKPSGTLRRGVFAFDS